MLDWAVCVKGDEPWDEKGDRESPESGALADEEAELGMPRRLSSRWKADS